MVGQTNEPKPETSATCPITSSTLSPVSSSSSSSFSSSLVSSSSLVERGGNPRAQPDQSGNEKEDYNTDIEEGNDSGEEIGFTLRK